MFVGYFVHNHTIMNFFATGHAYGRAPHVHVTLIPSITARGYRLMVPILFVVLVEMADTVSHGGQPEILRIVFVVTLMLGVIGVKGAKS